MGAEKGTERKGKMNLENYLQFIESQKQMDLTVNLLTEIIVMHGFKRINKAHKKVLIDAVDAIDLMDPVRSTLEKHTSLPEIAKLEDVIEDLNSLRWQECCVTSIQNLNSYKEDLPDVDQNLQIVSHSASVKTAPRKRKNVTQPKPKKTLKSVHNKCPGDAVHGGASASSSSKVAEKQRPETVLGLPAKRKVPEEGGDIHAPCCC